MTGSATPWPSDRGFVLDDGERVVRFGRGVAIETFRLLRECDIHSYVLVTTPRGRVAGPTLAAAAAAVCEVPHGEVPDAAQAIAAQAAGHDLLALGGGRVIDVAKALAAATGTRCAAMPTTLSGAEMNGHHRPMAGHESGARARPVLVITDPNLLTQPAAELAASAMNALAHAAEALVTPRANPVAEASALQAATLIADGLASRPPDRDRLALAGLLAGHALGLCGFAVHHVVAQTTVRLAGTPHAQTNAVLLPHSLRLLRARAPRQMDALDEALGRDPADLARMAGPATLADLDVPADLLGEIAATAAGRTELDHTPGGAPSQAELAELLDAAWSGPGSRA